MMTIEKALSNTGCPWAGGSVREVAPTEVTGLGKLRCWGSSCVQFMLRLRDGTEVFVKACDQSKEIEKWLRKAAKTIPVALTSRATGWTVSWVEISNIPEPLLHPKS